MPTAVERARPGSSSSGYTLLRTTTRVIGDFTRSETFATIHTYVLNSIVNLARAKCPNTIAVLRSSERDRSDVQQGSRGDLSANATDQRLHHDLQYGRACRGTVTVEVGLL
jgi:hypothetical protein